MEVGDYQRDRSDTKARRRPWAGAGERTRESGRSYTIFSDSEAAVRRIQTDKRGPGQRHAVEAIEVAGRLLRNGNKIETNECYLALRGGGRVLLNIFSLFFLALP